ncbi:MAG TPA: 30S ribosomal protein S24e, partial [Thermoplasmata archaeon]
MELQVLTKKDNPHLKRVEVTFKAIHKAEPTPTRDALRAFLARELKATKDIVVIDSQASSFGRYETHGYAKVYKSKEEALSVERKHILVRNK